MLVEGDDDKRIWEQVVRSTNGSIAVYPCSTGSISKIGDWESWLISNLPSIYDQPKAYSLRDRDGQDGELEDRPPVTRFRLSCRAAENLILAEETLEIVGISWQEVVDGCTTWLDAYPSHPNHASVQRFADGGFDRMNANVKEIRNVLMMLMGVTKPWEVLVGQAIATLTHKQSNGRAHEHSLEHYLGRKICVELLGI